MTDALEQRIIEIIQNTLRSNGGKPEVVIMADDSMDTIAAWDSLTFMSVFLAINESFGLNPDFDDAINYTSVKLLYAFLKEQVA
jgi:acyl carrier protein